MLQKELRVNPKYFFIFYISLRSLHQQAISCQKFRPESETDLFQLEFVVEENKITQREKLNFYTQYMESMTPQTKKKATFYE